MYKSLSVLVQLSILPLTICAIIIGEMINLESGYAQNDPISKLENSSNEESPKEAPPPSPKGYIGIGGNLGISGNTTALGTSGLSILSKQVLTELLAIHGNYVVFGSAAASQSTALTLNFPIRDNTSQEIVISPFLGAGIQTRSDGSLYINPLVVGGLDIPLSNKFTGTIRIEAGFPNTGKTDVGISVGVGYSF